MAMNVLSLPPELLLLARGLTPVASLQLNITTTFYAVIRPRVKFKMITDDDVHRYFWSVALANPNVDAQPLNPSNPIPASLATSRIGDPSSSPAVGLAGPSRTSYPTPTQARGSDDALQTKIEGRGKDKGKGKASEEDRVEVLGGGVMISGPSTSHIPVRGSIDPPPQPESGSAGKRQKRSKEEKEVRRARKEQKRLSGQSERAYIILGESISPPYPTDVDTEVVAIKRSKKKQKDDDSTISAAPNKSKNKSRKKRKLNNQDRRKQKQRHEEDELESIDSGADIDMERDQEEMDVAEIDELLPSSPVGFGIHFDSDRSSSSPSGDGDEGGDSGMFPVLDNPNSTDGTTPRSLGTKTKTTQRMGPQSQTHGKFNTGKSTKKQKRDSSTFDPPPPSSTHTNPPNSQTNPSEISVKMKIRPMSLSKSRPSETKVVDKPPDSYRLNAIPTYLRSEMGPPPPPLPQSTPSGSQSGTGADKPRMKSIWPTWVTSTPDYLKKKIRS